MSAKPILLKVLLKQRHLQGHRSFCKEYDRVAKEVEPDLVGSYPSKAQFYRWLSGELVGLPYADHCRIVERMFPDRTAHELFEPYNGGIEFVPEPSATGEPTNGDTSIRRAVPASSRESVGGIVVAFATRSEFSHEIPPRHLFDGASSIRLMGLSLNLICHQYSGNALTEMLEGGTTVDCLFLNPDGQHMALREQEEDDESGTLAELTRINMRVLRKLRAKLSDEAKDNLRIRTYDAVVRFNITIVDGATCVVQPYLPKTRGVESPTLVLAKQPTGTGLFTIFAQVLSETWDHGTEVTA
ncbi:MAG: DUF5919 domain-containing protein [Sciscionella sp.]